MTETEKPAKVYTPKEKSVLILEFLIEETYNDDLSGSHKKMTDKLDIKRPTIFYHLKQLVEQRILWKEDIPIICSNNQPKTVKRYHIYDDKLEMVKKLVSDFRNKA